MKAINQNLELVVAELESKLKALEREYEIAVERANTDDLTRLLRRRAFMERFESLLNRAKCENSEVYVLMVDIDHFKKVNDNYGHQTGDAVLERVSELIKQYLRTDDFAGRYGGEEIIVAIKASAAQVLWIAESIRMAVQKNQMVSIDKRQTFTLTLSMGIASSHKFGFEAHQLIAHADEALYQAKENGRNRVINANETLIEERIAA